MTAMARGLAFALFVACASLSLEAQDPAASYACDAKAGMLVIRYTPEADASWAGNGQAVMFGALLDLDEEETEIVGTRSQTVSCDLKSDRFRIELQPGVLTVNLLGRCGAAWTGIVTVTRNGKVVLEEQAFEELDCHERERMLEKIVFRDGVAAPELTYVGYESQ